MIRRRARMTTQARRASRRTESSQRGIGRFYSKFQRPALPNSEYLPKTLWTALEYQTALSWGYRAITQRYPAEGLAGLFAVRALPVVSGKTHTMRSFLSTRRAIPLALAGMLFCVGAAARAQSRQIPHGDVYKRQVATQLVMPSIGRIVTVYLANCSWLLNHFPLLPNNKK